MSKAAWPDRTRGGSSDGHRHLMRVAELAKRKSRQALQIRSADNTALGERAAGEADLDAAALRWVLGRLDNV